jgi:endoglucanase
VNYIYPADPWRATYFAGHGLRLVRLPFMWERVQESAFGGLSSSDIAAIRSVLDTAQGAGQAVILDMHNFARYYGVPLTTADAAKLANVWEQLAATFRGHPALYGYELMNEPHDLPQGAAGWAALAQAATTAIRQVDSQAYVLVPGYGWQSALYWPNDNPTLDIADPAGRLLYAAHQYFDADGSGTYVSSYDAEGAYPSIGADRVQPFLNWLANRNARGVLTEYGVPGSDPRWLNVLDIFLSTISNSPSIQGGTYWAAGPWWGSYPLSVEPTGAADQPQMPILAGYPSE